jgi:hypothetical protein
MKKLLVVLLIAGAGVPVYMKVAGSAFGVSPTNPLGEFQKIENWLLKDGEFTKAEVPMHHANTELPGWKAFEYVDVDQSKKERVVSTVTVMVDPAGEVRAIATQFHSGSKETGLGSRVETITQQLWSEMGGGTPTFAEQVMGSGETSQVHLVASLITTHARGSWRKIYLDTYQDRSLVDSCIFEGSNTRHFQESMWGTAKFPGTSGK